MSKNVNAIPEGYHSVTPYLIMKDAEKAIEFYTKAFGAKEIGRITMAGGKIGHAEIRGKRHRGKAYTIALGMSGIECF